MPVDPRKHYTRGMIIEGGGHPAICKGISPRAMPLKQRKTPATGFAEVARRLEAAAKRLEQIRAAVRASKTK